MVSKALLALGFVLLSILGGGTVFAEELTEAELVRVKEEIGLWSDSLKSFRGEYRLKDERFDDDSSPLLEFYIVHRFQNDDSYNEIYVGEKGGLPEFSYATRGGIGTRRVQAPGGPLTGNLNETEPFNIPNGAYMFPKELFGQRMGRTLGDLLNTGPSRAFRENGLILFCYRGEPISDYFDLLMDQEFNVLELSWVTWFKPREEDLRELGDLDPFRASVPDTKIEFSSFVEENSVKFPVLAIRHHYQPLEPTNQDLIRQLKAGEISRAKYMLWAMENSSIVESRRMTFVADPSSITLNPKLSDSDFILSFPEGTKVFDNLAIKAIVIEPWHKRLWRWRQHMHIDWERVRYAVLGISVAGTLLSGAIILRRRKK